jgi:hypothetical protein
MIISIANQLEYPGDRNATETSRRSSKCIQLETYDSIQSVMTFERTSRPQKWHGGVTKQGQL